VSVGNNFGWSNTSGSVVVGASNTTISLPTYGQRMTVFNLGPGEAIIALNTTSASAVATAPSGLNTGTDFQGISIPPSTNFLFTRSLTDGFLGAIAAGNTGSTLRVNCGEGTILG
jgi:hypothetical protein